MPENDLIQLPEMLNTAHKEETLKVSRASLDIATDVVTAVRSSDSEKNMAQNNSITEEVINEGTMKKHEVFRQRKQSGMVKVETTLVTELVRQPDQGLTERNEEPDKIKPFELDSGVKA